MDSIAGGRSDTTSCMRERDDATGRLTRHSFSTAAHLATQTTTLLRADLPEVRVDISH